MKTTSKLFLAVLVPAALIGASAVAEAHKGWHRGGIFKRLVKAGALTKEDLASLRPLGQQMRACVKQVRSGGAPRGSCLPKRAELLKARIALLQKALPSLQRPRLKRRTQRVLRKMTRRLARIERRLHQPPVK